MKQRDELARPVRHQAAAPSPTALDAPGFEFYGTVAEANTTHVSVAGIHTQPRVTVTGKKLQSDVHDTLSCCAAPGGAKMKSSPSAHAIAAGRHDPSSSKQTETPRLLQRAD